MTKLLTLWPAPAAILLTVLLIGCGSSSNTVPLLTHLSVTDSLQKELASAKMQNGTLNARVSRLEEEKRALALKIAELDSTINFLKTQIGRAPAAAPSTAPPSGEPQDVSYETALELFRAKNYAEGAAMFRSLLDHGVAAKLEDNSRYWLGECLFGEKKYGEAIENFRKIASYEKSEKKDESQLMIARSYARMGNADQAKIEYQKFLDTFPASPYLEQAKEQMARLK